MADEILLPHSQDPIPLHRNTLPVAECDIHTAQVGGKSCKAIDVPVLGCASVWLRLQKEAEAWIAPNGNLIADPILRNRRINQAYAQLWLADPRFQWSGLAAFASKQVGCGLLHAADNIKKSLDEIEANSRDPGIMSNTDIAAADTIPATIAASSSYIFGQLALGNTTLFLDIYPLHRFYMLRGFKQLKNCLGARSSIAANVLWPIDSAKVPFGRPCPAILEGFALIEQHKIADSVKELARHEQLNILQPAIYNDLMMKRALDANQFSWATNFPHGVAAEIQLTYSAACRLPSTSRSTWFSKNRTAQLYDPVQRMQFVLLAATRFDSLLHGSEHASIEASLREIGSNGGKL